VFDAVFSLKINFFRKSELSRLTTTAAARIKKEPI